MVTVGCYAIEPEQDRQSVESLPCSTATAIRAELFLSSLIHFYHGLHIRGM